MLLELEHGGEEVTEALDALQGLVQGEREQSRLTVGKRKAVVDLPGFSFQGLFAWLTWMFVHLMLILSVKNRLFIFLNWMMSYLANDSTLRLMLKPETPAKE